MVPADNNKLRERTVHLARLKSFQNIGNKNINSM